MPPSRRTRSHVSSTLVVDPKTIQDVITDNMLDAPTNQTHTYPQPVENLKGAALIKAVANLIAVMHKRLDPAPATSNPRPIAVPTLEILAEPMSLKIAVSLPAVAPKGLDLSPTSPKSINTTLTSAQIKPTITNVNPCPANSELAIDKDRLRFLERKLNETKDLLRPKILALKKKLKIVNPIINLTIEEEEPKRVSRSCYKVLDMQDLYMRLAKRKIKSLDIQVC
ncbi:hypothetical protein B0J14DRAFT_654551 [Halenospora varia]|nr:hypothetical protein B0J14DRAFT_654551 [Halenospora varia]